MATINFHEMTVTTAEQLRELLLGRVTDAARAAKMHENLPLTLDLLVAASKSDAAGVLSVAMRMVEKSTAEATAARQQVAVALDRAMASAQEAQIWREGWEQRERDHEEECSALREQLEEARAAAAAAAAPAPWPAPALPSPPRLTRSNALGGGSPVDSGYDSDAESRPSTISWHGDEEEGWGGGGAAAAAPAPEEEIVCWGGGGYCPAECACGGGTADDDGEETPDHYHPEDEI
jgi:hypothetical protein